MANILIRINTDNDAFFQDESGELVRILRELAQKIEGSPVSHVDDMRLRDVNGNACGGVEYCNE